MSGHRGMSEDRVGFGLALLAVATAATTGALDPWTATGPPVVDERPGAWSLRASAGAMAEALPDGRVSLVVGACGDPQCRAVVERRVDLEGGSDWVVTAEVVRLRPGTRAKAFVSASDLGDFRWYGGRSFPESGAGVARAVVHDDLSAMDANVGVIVVGPDAHVEVGRVTVAPAGRSVAYLAAFSAMVAAYGGAGVHAARRTWRALDRPGASAALGLAALLLVGVAIPQAWLDELVAPVADARFLVQKLAGHGGAFLLFGALGARGGAPPTLLLARLAAVAVASEALQLANPGRTASAADVAIDVAGAVLGILLVRIASRDAPRAPRGSAASPP